MSERLLRGDCLELLPTVPDDSIDAIVTDPPYELGFRGKSWDSSGIAHNVDLWRECLRVLKPGGHLLAFGGSRTYHRLACAVEDAGFEIRDQIQWLYGAGFPKSLDVSKAIDKAAGAEREVVGTRDVPKGPGFAGPTYGGDSSSKEVDITAPATPQAQQWQGWGTALKPAHEPIVVARKPLVGTVASNVLTCGTGALNIDGCRVGGPDGHGGGAKASSGFVDGYEGDGFVASDQGRWPANVIHDGSDEVLAGFPVTAPSKASMRGSRSLPFDESGNKYEDGMRGIDDDGGSAARFFYCAKASKAERNAGLEGLPELTGGEATGRTDDSDGLKSPRAGAGRTGGTRNHHPTVKPLALMRYLVRLVTPPGGVVLDPFLGSGTTAVAAILEGFDWVGCEMTEDYWPIIEARVEWAHAQEVQGTLEFGATDE